MAQLKERLREDLTAAMKNRQEIERNTLRMALAAIQKEEVAGASARELSDDEVTKVIARELKKRNEAAEIFANAGRNDKADAEIAEAEVLKKYLPEQLDTVALEDLVRSVVAEISAEVGTELSPKHMGQVMKAANAKVAGRADGAQVSAIVRAVLQG